MNSVDFLFEVFIIDLPIVERIFIFQIGCACLIFLTNLCGQMVDTRQLLYLYERGKKKLMEGNKIVFKGLCLSSIYIFFSSNCCVGISCNICTDGIH